MNTEIDIIDADKIGSATSPLGLRRTVAVLPSSDSPRAGDVVVVRALTDSATYNMLELPTGRLAKSGRVSRRVRCHSTNRSTAVEPSFMYTRTATPRM